MDEFKKKSSFFRKKSLLFLLVGAVFFFCHQAVSKKKDLPDKYRKWLEEEVVYIITPLEKEVFLKLETSRERDLLIEAFWKQRDPTPGTQKNEFKTEHYRRINHANHYFGRGTPKPGWRTDRGRIYILLGEPQEIQEYEGKTEIYPTKVWFYQGKTKLGLPPGFNLVFYKRGVSGEYKLYSPLQDGPQALLTSYWGDPSNYLEAYERLYEYSPLLAEVSVSLIPGDSSGVIGRPSLSSDLLIQKVESVPQRQIKDIYAQKFMEYKDVVEVDYTANYIDSDSLVKVIRDPSGMYFVHYAIEPEKFSVNQYEDKYYTKLKLNGRVSDKSGNTIYQFENNIELEFNQEQMRDISRRPLCIRDMFPLIPGNFSVSILMQNEVSKEFTSLEREIIIPGEEDKLQMTSRILAYKLEEDKPPENRLRPFQSGLYKMYLQANRMFLRKDDLSVTFQLHGLNQDLKERGKIQYTFMKSGEIFQTVTKDMNEYENLPTIVETFPLEEFYPDYYKVKVALFIDGEEVLSGVDEFVVTHMESIARPWIYSKLMPPSDRPVYSYILGTQYFNHGEKEKAKQNLERAYYRNPQSIEFALNLARLYMELKNYEMIIHILSPFLQAERAEYEVYLTVGKAYQSLGQMGQAVQIFDRAISHYGINTNVLNSLGDCYFQLGKTKEASKVWKKSLEMNSNQPKIRTKIEELKVKK